MSTRRCETKSGCAFVPDLARRSRKSAGLAHIVLCQIPPDLSELLPALSEAAKTESKASGEPFPRLLPHGHPADLEPSGDRHGALSIGAQGSNLVHFVRRQWCSRSPRWVRHDPRIWLGCRRFFARAILFRLFPRGTQPFQSLPRVRAESTGLHVRELKRAPPDGGAVLFLQRRGPTGSGPPRSASVGIPTPRWMSEAGTPRLRDMPRAACPDVHAARVHAGDLCCPG